MREKRFILTAVCLLCVLLTACRPPETVPYSRLLSELTDAEAIARLDVPGTEMICSYDRTGANEDYNHFQGKTTDGQMILADLKGPGVMSRLWFTGISSDKKIRFHFDGEKVPRLEFSWEDLRRGVPPFDLEPISIDEQNCWHTYLPVPFKKRLLITTEDAGYRYGRAPKMYYQINWQKLPKGQTVESFDPVLEPQQRRLLESAADAWGRMEFAALPSAETSFEPAAGASVELWSGQGPRTVKAFTLESDVHDPDALRNVLLKIYWDGNTEPSVAVPLGDFFGSVWQRWRAQSMLFGSVGNTFFCRFPMPFRQSARFVLENKSAQAVALKFGVETGPHMDGGYFHADWRNSAAADTGVPHIVLQAAGRGRFAGCILSVVSADRSFWVLEADESMWIDGQKTWQGTGLEDYFNSGWYYGNVFSRPLHGLPNKAPFRTVQYRVHLTDPVVFDRSFRMEFERGPDHASHAAYESAAFYYLDQPQPSGSRLENRVAPVDALQPYTLMTDLWNFERFGDLQGQAEYIDRYSAQFNPPFSDLLELRKQVCLYESGQIEKQPFMDRLTASTNEQAAVLKKLYTEPDAVLIGFYCNMPSELYLNGERILSAGDPQKPAFALLTLKKGKHVLAAASGWQEYPKWTQVAVRTADGFLIGTSGDWKHAVNPDGKWMEPDYDDTVWASLGEYDGRVKGPPEEPYIWVTPDPFVNTLSQTYGLRPSAPWVSKKGRVVYRKVFEIQ